MQLSPSPHEVQLYSLSSLYRSQMMENRSTMSERQLPGGPMPGFPNSGFPGKNIYICIKKKSQYALLICFLFKGGRSILSTCFSKGFNKIPQTLSHCMILCITQAIFQTQIRVICVQKMEVRAWNYLYEVTQQVNSSQEWTKVLIPVWYCIP